MSSKCRQEQPSPSIYAMTTTIVTPQNTTVDTDGQGFIRHRTEYFPSGVLEVHDAVSTLSRPMSSLGFHLSSTTRGHHGLAMHVSPRRQAWRSELGVGARWRTAYSPETQERFGSPKRDPVKTSRGGPGGAPQHVPFLRSAIVPCRWSTYTNRPTLFRRLEACSL